MHIYNVNIRYNVNIINCDNIIINFYAKIYRKQHYIDVLKNGIFRKRCIFAEIMSKVKDQVKDAYHDNTSLYLYMQWSYQFHKIER